IEITADDVTLDLNGFSITGPTFCSGYPTATGCTLVGTGVGISSTTSNVTVTNGTVRGMGSFAIQSSGAGTRIEKIRAFNNGGGGIACTATGCVVKESIVDGNGGLVAVSVSDGCTVTGTTASGNGGHGIQTGPVCTVSDNTANNNGSDGINSQN